MKARQLIYRYSTNTIKLRVKKLDMDINDILKGNVIVRRRAKNGGGEGWGAVMSSNMAQFTEACSLSRFCI